MKIFTAAVVLAALSGSVAFGQEASNQVFINQLGTKQSAVTSQRGKNNYASITQNVAGSNGNSTVLDQRSTDNVAFIAQTGTRGIVAEGSSAFLQSGNANTLEIAQSGVDNTLSGRQTGRDNMLTLTQTGENNTTSSRQTGAQGAVTVNQGGLRNAFGISQGGLGNAALISQNGEDGFITSAQSGASNQLDAIQNGTGNSIYTSQTSSAGDLINVRQDGSMNSAEVSQRN